MNSRLPQTIAILVVGHISVAFALPSSGAALLAVLGAADLATGFSQAVIGSVAAVFFLSIPCLVAVVICSPVFYALSRLRNRWLTWLGGGLTGVLAGTVFASTMVVRGSETSFASAVVACGALVGAAGSLILVWIWGVALRPWAVARPSDNDGSASY